MPGLTQASHVSQRHWISVLSNLASFKCNYKGPAHLGKLSGQNAQPPATSAQAAALPGSTLRVQCRGLQVVAYTCACSGVPAPVSHTYTFMSLLAPGRCLCPTDDRLYFCLLHKKDGARRQPGVAEWFEVLWVLSPRSPLTRAKRQQLLCSW